MLRQRDGKKSVANESFDSALNVMKAWQFFHCVLADQKLCFILLVVYSHFDVKSRTVLITLQMTFRAVAGSDPDGAVAPINKRRCVNIRILK